MKRVEYLGAVISAIGLVAGVIASPATPITLSKGDRFTGTTHFTVKVDNQVQESGGFQALLRIDQT